MLFKVLGTWRTYPLLFCPIFRICACRRRRKSFDHRIAGHGKTAVASPGNNVSPIAGTVEIDSRALAKFYLQDVDHYLIFRVKSTGSIPMIINNIITDNLR